MNQKEEEKYREAIFERIDHHHKMAHHYIEKKDYNSARLSIGKAEGLIEAIRILRGADV